MHAPLLALRPSRLLRLPAYASILRLLIFHQRGCSATTCSGLLRGRACSWPQLQTPRGAAMGPLKRSEAGATRAADHHGVISSSGGAPAPLTPQPSKRARGGPAAAARGPAPPAGQAAPAAPGGANGLGSSIAAASASTTTAGPTTSLAARPPLAAAAPADAPLLQLGTLVTGTVVRRPSASVRTPYVADVQLHGDDAGGGATEVLAHTPALDCAGMIVPGCRVHLTANTPKPSGQPTKTSHTVWLAEDPREDGTVAAVGAHPLLAERLVEAALLQGRLEPELGPFAALRRQRTFGGARVDFVLEAADGSQVLLEVKNVVCADYPEDGVPPGRTKVGVYTSAAKPYSRTALFPHGAVKKGVGVVSDRAIKHLHELVGLQAAGQHEGVPLRCAVLFLVNRSDCVAFRPCHEADPVLARMVQHAERSGVAVLAYDVAWSGGAARWGRRLPVRYGEGVAAADIDWAHIRRVLEFNSTDPRTHWKAAAKNKKKKKKQEEQEEEEDEED